jgi:hypothetical protein
MNVAQAWNAIKGTFGWIGGFAGIGSLVIWIFGFKKLRLEIEKLRTEIAGLKKRGLVSRAVLILRGRAGIILSNSNVAILSRAEWASFLPDSTLIDEALQEVGAIRVPGKLDYWEIRLTEKRQPERFSRR